jgi:hypothetical protein
MHGWHLSIPSTVDIMEWLSGQCTLAEFLDVIGTEFSRVFLLAIYSHLTDFTPSPSKSDLYRVCEECR